MKFLLGFLSAFGLLWICDSFYRKGAQDYKDEKWIKTDMEQENKDIPESRKRFLRSKKETK